MSKKSKSIAAYVKGWNASITYEAPSRVRSVEQRIKTIITECGGVATAFKPIPGSWYCVGKFLTRKQAELADRLAVAAGYWCGDVFLNQAKGKFRVAVVKDVEAQEQAFIDKAFDDFLSESCLAHIAKAVNTVLATTTKDFAAVEKKAVSAACDEFYGVGKDGCPPHVQEAIDEFYSSDNIDLLLCDFDYEAAYEKAVDRLLAA